MLVEPIAVVLLIEVVVVIIAVVVGIRMHAGFCELIDELGS